MTAPKLATLITNCIYWIFNLDTVDRIYDYFICRHDTTVIDRFYSNDPVDTMDHIARGNPIYGSNRYTYANNNPYKYTDPDGEFGIIGFAIGFVADATVQYAITGEVDVQQSLFSGVVGSVTGGLTSLAKSGLTVGGKFFYGAFVVAGSGTAGAGGYAVNESLNGNTPTLKKNAVNGLMSASGLG